MACLQCLHELSKVLVKLALNAGQIFLKMNKVMDLDQHEGN